MRGLADIWASCASRPHRRTVRAAVLVDPSRRLLDRFVLPIYEARTQKGTLRYFNIHSVDERLQHYNVALILDHYNVTFGTTTWEDIDQLGTPPPLVVEPAVATHHCNNLTNIT